MCFDPFSHRWQSTECKSESLIPLYPSCLLNIGTNQNGQGVVHVSRVLPPTGWLWTKCIRAVMGSTRSIIMINSLTARVVGAPQMILQPVFSIFLRSPLPSWTWRTPGLSVPWCCLPTSSSVCLVFFPLLLCLARWFWPDLMNGKHDHTTAVCVSLRDLHVVQLPAGTGWRAVAVRV